MSRIIRICAMGCGLLGGLVASQGPEFSQQYRQRLGGGIDELRQVVARFDADARAHGETPESAITRLRGNADDLASRQGTAMQGNHRPPWTARDAPAGEWSRRARSGASP